MKFLFFCIVHIIALLLFCVGLNAQVLQDDVIITRTKPSTSQGLTALDLPLAANCVMPGRQLQLTVPTLGKKRPTHLLLQAPNGQDILVVVPPQGSVSFTLPATLRSGYRYTFVLKE